eukprot:TRINITY_DN98162_c0_g1_i1.p1 TRINITY_DN98162_c0_g1~~TRINITY_DN98162_c0_g1_i1.p1  ORF type:complete len:235 (-),score=36.01 TRINITY_DN98162_c0_g1_i1:274-978(-)
MPSPNSFESTGHAQDFTHEKGSPLRGGDVARSVATASHSYPLGTFLQRQEPEERDTGESGEGQYQAPRAMHLWPHDSGSDSDEEHMSEDYEPPQRAMGLRPQDLEDDDSDEGCESPQQAMAFHPLSLNDDDSDDEPPHRSMGLRPQDLEEDDSDEECESPVLEQQRSELPRPGTTGSRDSLSGDMGETQQASYEKPEPSEQSIDADIKFGSHVWNNSPSDSKKSWLERLAFRRQ